MKTKLELGAWLCLFGLGVPYVDPCTEMLLTPDVQGYRSMGGGKGGFSLHRQEERVTPSQQEEDGQAEMGQSSTKCPWGLEQQNPGNSRVLTFLLGRWGVPFPTGDLNVYKCLHRPLSPHCTLVRLLGLLLPGSFIQLLLGFGQRWMHGATVGAAMGTAVGIVVVSAPRRAK